jgi:hypothetical protein
MENTDEDINERSEELVSRLYNLEGLMPQIRPLFQGLYGNQLRSFQYVKSHSRTILLILINDNSWHLGTCVPQDLLGPGGYLPTRQCKIEDLSLLTSDPCILPHHDWEWQMSLTQFKSRKTFSWIGGLSREDFDELRDMFRSQASKLEVLKIDLLDWWGAQWN